MDGEEITEAEREELIRQTIAQAGVSREEASFIVAMALGEIGPDGDVIELPDPYLERVKRSGRDE